MSAYPFNECREQVDWQRCPAPFCGLDWHRWRRAWKTPVFFAEDRFASFAEAVARPVDSFKASVIVTCDAAACRTWARLRAEDIAGTGEADPHVRRFRWETSPYFRGFA